MKKAMRLKTAATATPEYIEFEALMLKENGAWKILMEYQKAPMEKAAWDALAAGG